jgi:hypothetical protein
MNENQNDLSDILSLTGIFRLEKGGWPLHAAELQGFALGLNRSLDFRAFHRFRFQAVNANEVLLEFWVRFPHSPWARRTQARVFLTPEKTISGDTLPLSVTLSHLSLQKVEDKSFCLI